MEGSRVAARDRDGPAEEAQTGEASLETLYARHIQEGVRLAYLLEGDRMRAEDLAQEAFIRCVGRFRHLRHPDAFQAYLRRAIVNLHTSGLRRRRLERAWLARERARQATSTVTMPDVGVRTDLWAALASLPPRQRAALVLRYYEDLSERDTASVMGCSVASVKSLVSRGSRTLRERIGREEP